MGHRSGQSRQQTALFPVMLDEVVGEHALVRVVDAWVGSVNLVKLGFEKAQAQVRGAPPYDPGDLLKLYIWGYLSGVRSSRSLERECHRNVECMWLLGRLAPDHKTIAQFRRCNTDALVAVCASFIDFARRQHLIKSATVAIDGSKVRAVASRKAILSQKVLEQKARRNAEEVASYLKRLDTQDIQEAGGELREADVRRALERLQAEGAQIEQHQQQLASVDKKTLVQSEPEAQVMHSLHKAPGYNLQAAVEASSHLIVHHQVCCDANDLHQLKPIAQAASQVLGQPCMAVADTGYANGEHIAQLAQQGITTFVAPNSGGNNTGLFDKASFSFDETKDHYVCPAGKVLKRQRASKQANGVIYGANPKDCGGCALKPGCTRAGSRSVTRNVNEQAIAGNAQRVQEHPEMMVLRRSTVEHPFGSIKNHILVNGRLLRRGLAGAQGELSLAVLVYNIKRVFNMKGSAWMRQALQG